jgi:uracil-DNA glycosylase family 4
METGAKNRVKLWLKSERAFGLSAVRAPGGQSQREDEVESEPVVVPTVRSAANEKMYAQVAAPNEMAPRGGLVAPPIKEPFTAPNLKSDDKSRRLIALDQNEVRGCTRCRLCETRTNTVFGEGDPDASIVFIGEGPGQTEDETGRPFVGRAGDLLTRQIGAMGFSREQVYICNIVKCRPPGNRQPAPDEAATCTPYLERQIEIIRPKVIVTLGLSAARYMLNTKESMGRLRGNWKEWRGIKLMPTFHPAYLLRQYTPETRAAVWSDLKQVLAELKLPVPKN